MELSFDELGSDGTLFEHLVADYFENRKENQNSNIQIVDVRKTGVGPDGGRDILLKMKVYDTVKRFDRIWVVQCKFHNTIIGKSKLSDVNIPSLIHEYRANGYLLVCKTTVTSELTKSFDNLNDNCKFGYSYHIWDGIDFLNLIRENHTILERYFPSYFNFQKSLNHRI